MIRILRASNMKKDSGPMGLAERVVSGAGLTPAEEALLWAVDVLDEIEREAGAGDCDVAAIARAAGLPAVAEAIEKARRKSDATRHREQERDSA